MQTKVSAMKTFHLSFTEMSNIGFTELLWMFKEYNKIHAPNGDKNKEEKSKGSSLSSFKNMSGVKVCN